MDTHAKKPSQLLVIHGDGVTVGYRTAAPSLRALVPGVYSDASGCLTCNSLSQDGSGKRDGLEWCG
jgi:hypothetical protein